MDIPKKDTLRIEARLRNNILWHAIYDMWPSVAAFCRESGFGQDTVGRLLNLTESPLRANKEEYREVPKRLAAYLGFSCDELYPIELYSFEQVKVALEVPTKQLTFGLGAPLLLTEPENLEDVVTANDLRGKLDHALRTLTPREEKVLRMRFGLDEDEPMTREQVAEDFDISPKRVRQIEAKALRKLRQPSRSKMFTG